MFKKFCSNEITKFFSTLAFVGGIIYWAAHEHATNEYILVQIGEMKATLSNVAEKLETNRESRIRYEIKVDQMYDLIMHRNVNK